MSEYLDRLEKRIRLLKNAYRGQNDFRTARIEIQKRGGRWKAENGLTYLLRDGVIYVISSGGGITKTTIIAYDAKIPYTAELSTDLQSVRPEDRIKMLEELNQAIEQRKPGTITPGPGTARPKIIGPTRDLIFIHKNDWLSKISLKRWGTTNWKLHLKPTEMTLNSSKRRGRWDFNEDLIYPGDSFEVIH